MGNLQSGSSSGDGANPPKLFLHGFPPESAASAGQRNPVVILRKDLAEGLQPPAAILHAAAEAARTLTGADGAAVALRTKGVIVCRACSGDPTPDLGAPVNTDSGITGECLRAATILICHDSENDSRVDPDVCRFMGIRSIAVVPLRGPTGIAGILEVFSVRAEAFAEREIELLRSLAEIVETAYGREVRGLQPKSPVPAKPARVGMASGEGPSSAKSPAQQYANEKSLPRRLWVIGGALAVMLGLAGVWLGREPALETSAKEPAKTVHGSTSESVPTPVTVTQPKPRAGVVRAERSAGEAVRNAASIELVEGSAAEPLKIAPGRSFAVEAAKANTEEPNPEPPPVTAGSTDTSPAGLESRDELAKLTATPSTFPSLDAAVSQGITPGRLIHKVNPVYPAQARSQHISGMVSVEITIADDGSVRDVKEISGTPLLADAARDAIRRWRYTPFLLNGKPVEVQKQISVTFKLP
jgi:TonB family protein